MGIKRGLNGDEMGIRDGIGYFSLIASVISEFEYELSVKSGSEKAFRRRGTIQMGWIRDPSDGMKHPNVET